MKRILNTLIFSAVLMLAFSCQEKEMLEVDMNESIVLDLSSGMTKAADTPTEAVVNHLDVFIFKAVSSGGSYVQGDKVYNGRYTVNNASTVTLNVKRSSFGKDDRFYVYLIANSNLQSADMDAVASYNELQNLKQEDAYLHHTGLTTANAPKYFLMDALAVDSSDNSPVQLNNGVVSDNTVLDAVLRRAAAKVVINIEAGADVEFHNFTGDIESDGGLYYVRNLPYDTYVLSGVSSSIIEAKRRTTMRGSSAYFSWSPETDSKSVSLTVYVYPHHWTNESLLDHETCVIMNLPMYFKKGQSDESVHKNSWYKIHMTDDQMFERNHYYQVDINLNRPGATSDSNPMVLTDLYYAVEDWTAVEVEVGGEDRPKYLQLNTDLVEMHNVNENNTSLEFASSSAITSITLVSESAAGLDSYTSTLSTSMVGYYVDKFGQPQEVSSAIRSQISASCDNSALSGPITISTPLPLNDTPRYMTYEVTNADGLKAYFTVVQYPVIYITNIEGYYSYRDDFKASNGSVVHYQNRVSPYIQTAYWASSYVARLTGSGYYGNWETVPGSEVTGVSLYGNADNYYDAEGNQLTGNGYSGRYVQYTEGGDTYRRYYTNINEVFDSDVRRSVYTTGANAGKSNLDTYYNNGGQWSYSNSKDPGNQRMYHVHVTATSSEYNIARPKILDSDGNVTTNVENGYTDDSADNALLVSPSFMIASQLGVTSSVNSSSENNYQRALNQCRNYVETYQDENGNVVHLKDWRLPTKAEIDIIAQLQEKTDGAVDIVLAGDYYFCASPERYTAGAGTDANGYFIRCIRDVY